jgi:hypothetical protein
MSDIPKNIKEHNWGYYTYARSDDPATKCSGVRSLVSSLITTMKIGEITEYDKLLEINLIRANKAMNLLSNREWGQAVELANAVLDDISFFVYDTKFSIQSSILFIGRGEK